MNRNIFKLPIAWFDEISTFSMIYMALIGPELGLRDGTQIAVTAVVDRLKGKLRQIVEIIAKVVVVIFSSSILITSIKLVSIQIQTGQTSAALEISMAVPYMALVISFTMIVLVQIMTIVKDTVNMIKNKTEETEEEK